MCQAPVAQRKRRHETTLTLNALHAAELGLTVLATASVAILLLVADARRASQQWLAAFLLLVSANFAAELAATGTGLWVDLGLSTSAAVDPWARTFHSMATVVLALDPFALVYFASLFPRRTGIAARGWAAAALGLVAASFVAIEVTTRGISTVTPLAPLRIAFFAYLIACYLWGGWRLLRSFLDEPSSIMAVQLRVTLVGALFVLFSRVALVSVDIIGPGSTEAVLVDLSFRLAIVAVLLGISMAIVRRSSAPAARRAEGARAVRTAALLLAGIAALWIVAGAAALLGATLLQTAASDSVFAVRWFVFSGAMIAGIVRYQALSVGRRAAQVASSLVAGLALVTLTATAALAFGPWTGVVIASAAILLVAVALPTALARFESSRRFHVLARRRLEIYRARLASALASGGLTPMAERALARERSQLGITDVEHEALLAIAVAEESGRGSPTLLGRYRIVRRLGAGSYASVYLAEDQERHELVALKRIHAEWVGDAGALDAAMREAEVAKRISHPRVVVVHDVQPLDDGFLIVMRYAENGSLRDRMAGGKALSPGEVAALGAGVLDGLAALHEAGVVHGDMKPENILLDRTGEPLLADLGSARAERGVGARTLRPGEPRSTPGGTPRYMAPEVARGEPATRASDVYAVGAVLYEALTGAPWMDDARRSDVRVDASPLPDAWRPFFERALATRPEARYRSAEEARRALPASTGTGRFPLATPDGS